MTKIIDGKKTALEIREEIRKEILHLKHRKPHLAFILVGFDEASQIYVRAKQKACKIANIESTRIDLPEEISEESLLKEIEKLNKNPLVDGIIVQLPLPMHISDQKVMETIHPNKDVDGFHPTNVGKLLLGQTDGFISCTPLGIQELLKRNAIETSGKHIVILGRSNIVGKPLAALLMQKNKGANATVTVLHSGSKNIEEITRSADIIIAAIGKANFIKNEMIQKGAILIDVGINRLQDGTLRGDIDFENVYERASQITPVPGGVGPMTIAMLLKNTLLSCKKRHIS